ncbi:MAG: RNA polymerase sigma factor [Kofleriaceae bacterium]
MPIFENNRDLLERFRRGDRAALAAVYDYYVDEVALLARRGFVMESAGHVYVTGTDLDGEHELIQETFVKAFSEAARSSYDGLRPYRPFLLRITKNLMIDRFRKRRRANARDAGNLDNVDDLPDANVELTVAPEDDLHWKALSAVTAELVASLDDESRAVVRLRYEQELSQDAAASELGCTRRRIRTIERRIEAELRRRLKRLEPGPK